MRGDSRMSSYYRTSFFFYWLKRFKKSGNEDFVKQHPNQEVYYVTRYADTVYSSFDFSDPVKDIYVMFGRESTGIPHDILREHPDHLLRLPMVPEARSLNLSNCVAIIVYEILRQQKFPNLATSEAIKGEDFLNNENKK